MSAAGGAWPAYRRAVRRAWTDAGADADARAAIVASVVDAGCPGAWPGGGTRLQVPAPPAAMATPDLPGLVLEALLDPTDRRRAGRHHTPAPIADGIVRLALGEGRVVASVCDPAVGGGAFLLAFVRAAVATGMDAADAVRRCHGCDLDPLAVEVTRAALRWAGGDGVEVRIVVGDGLEATGEHDLVIGNPPFQGQLASSTARSQAARARAAEALDGRAGYADTAGLFLVAACELARPGGTVALLQPESLLTTRDAAPVRERVRSAGRMRAAWVAGERVFEATVRVWAPVIDVGAPAGDAVEVMAGAGFERREPVVLSASGDSWGALLASVHGTPATVHRSAGVLGDIATATAGFRDQFYGLVPYVEEGTEGAPLVTSGSIDPMSCSWADRPVRFARRDWKRPVVALDRLAAGDPELHRWVSDRLVPKVLVATQTRVVEAFADPEGGLIPSVPVVAVACEDVWPVAAALSAPPVTAWALRRAAGAALAADAVKLSARQILEVPLPADRGLWDDVAARLAAGDLAAPEFAELMTRAYGLPGDDPVVAWWLARLPSWVRG